jgi:hypothetical protein
MLTEINKVSRISMFGLLSGRLSELKTTGKGEDYYLFVDLQTAPRCASEVM